MNKNIYSVGQVNTYIKNMFLQDFMLRKISVKGEVSNCKYHSSGHIYFTIKDSSGSMSAIMFSGDRRGMTFRMKEGDQVVVTGRVEVYERDGKYQLYAKQIELDGAGNLYLRFEALKRELEEMGMFAAEYKQPIPKYVRTVGIVTAPTGAAVQDIRNIATRRNPYVQLILYPALVQGAGAASSIVNGIHAMEQLGVDVMIVGRGGGSIEDLWAFNEEMVARAIFDCPIPIISAVGHETDWTIADFVADLRAPTPSAAAELAVFDYMQTVHELQKHRERLQRGLEQRIAFASQRLKLLQTQLAFHSPENQLNEKRQKLADYEETFRSRMEWIYKEKCHRLQLLAGTLDGYSPAKKLSQGYSFVVTPDGKALRNIAQVKPQEEIAVHLMDGVVHAVVTKSVKTDRNQS